MRKRLPTRMQRPLGIVIAVLCLGGAAAPAVAGQESLAPGPVQRLSNAFNEAWRWVRFTQDSGLPSNSVYQLIETPAGTVWAATHRGLAWYDGYRWTPMGPADGIPADLPGSIGGHGDDDILVVIRRRLYRGNRDGFREIPVNDGGRAAEAVAVIPTGPASSVLLAARDRDAPVRPLLYEADALHPLRPEIEVAWDQDTVNGWGDGAGALWLNTISALQHWDGERWQKQLTPANGEAMRVEHLVETASGNGMFSVSSPPAIRGLWEWSAGTAPRRNASEPTDLLESMDIAPNGDAIAVYRSGDVRLRQGGTWSPLEPVPPHVSGVLFVKFRANGDLWMGTQRGLYLYRTSLARWAHWQTRSPDARNEILDIAVASDGAVWLATGRGLAVHRPGGAVEWIESINGMPLSEITGLAQASDGSMWISSGSSLSGAYRWDGREWRHFGFADGLEAPLVHRIRRDRHGRLWFLGMAPLTDFAVRDDQPGAFALQNDVFTPWTTRQGLINGRVYDLAEGADGTLWFATFGGLSRWRDGRWSHWTTANGLRKNRIFTVAVDHADRLWFGDQGSGLGYIDAQDHPQYLTTADGLVHDEVQALSVGPRGELWITTRGGLACRHNDEWLSFDVTSGLRSPNLWPIVPLEDRVIIGSAGAGVDVLSLAEADDPAPRVTISPPVIERDSALLRWTATAYWGQMPDQNVETRYRLDGDAWSRWSTSREVTLRRLPSGAHSFELQAKGLFGGLDDVAAVVPFVSAPPFYREPAFVVSMGILGILVLALFATRRRHALTLRQRDGEYRRELEARVEERTDALRESEERLRLLLETTNVIPWEADAVAFNFTYVGPQAIDVLGYPLERWYEPTFWQDHIHADDLDAAIGYCAAQSAITDRYEFEYRMIAADGGIVWIHDLVSVVRDDGKAKTLRGFMIDITRRKRAEAERLRAEAETLEHRERLAHISRVNMLGEMASGIAHEVNQPLTAVSSYTQACRRMIETDSISREQIIDILDRISHEAVRAGDMIHGLKALARKRNGQLTVCNVNELVRDVVPLAEVEARNLGIEIKLSLDDTLPDIAADAVQIQQVVLNLIRNAIEATEPHTGRVEVRSSPASAFTIEIEVADNGRGIDQADLERVFHPFFSTKESGMGMGLAISRNIVEAHGGSLAHRLSPLGGRAFYFQLPVNGRTPGAAPTP